MRIRTTSIVASCILSLLACALLAQEQSPDQAKMEALWKAFSTPCEHHARFQEMVGNWTVKTTDYTMNSSAPAITSGDATFETIMGGRYLLQHFRSTVNGEAFEGMGITGYDNAKQEVRRQLDRQHGYRCHVVGRHAGSGHPYDDRVFGDVIPHGTHEGENGIDA